MSLKQQIDADIKKAMLAKKKEELTALRSIKSMILLAETEKGAASGISEEAEAKILMKASKQRKDSADLYNEQGRNDLALVEMGELEIINRYLPEQMSEEKLEEGLKEIIAQVGASGMKDMGKVMGMATKTFVGKADGKAISKLVKKLLN